MFSTCVDDRFYLTSVHWRRVHTDTGVVSYEMSEISSGLLGESRDMVQLQILSKHLLHWAREERLPRILKALEDYPRARPPTIKPPVQLEPWGPLRAIAELNWRIKDGQPIS